MSTLQLKLTNSELSPHLKWNVDWTVYGGVGNWLKGPNGVGKSSLFEEIKCQWKHSNPHLKLGFTDQASLDPFQDLNVGQVFELLWDIVPDRRLVDDWRLLPDWDVDAKTLWARHVKLLSGGENQWIKLMMMRSLKSDVWLLDEPFQFLDQRRHEILRHWLLEWCQQNRFLIFTHHGEKPLDHLINWTMAQTPTGLGVRESL